MKKYIPTAFERKKYVLATQKDIEILGKCKELEKRRLTKEERILVKLVKTQLEEDWRTPLRKAVDKLLKK